LKPAPATPPRAPSTLVTYGRHYGTTEVFGMGIITLFILFNPQGALRHKALALGILPNVKT
jgi:hypothetical protein